LLKYNTQGNKFSWKKMEIDDKDINGNASKNNLNSCLDNWN
jgi:hypothetical protein